jgi:tRNA 2-thiouridine synthesizing protein A
VAATEENRLNALGLLCPMPVIRTQDAMRKLQPGTVLEVLATDPGALHDIRAWCRVHGHPYVDDWTCVESACGSTQPHFHIRLRVSD